MPTSPDTATIPPATPPAAPGGAAPDDTAGRPMRADARANRRRLLEAAAAVFAAEGVAAPISEVARHAGVGMGTVYRHFPTKEALFEAIVGEHLELLLATADSLLGAEDAGRALDEFLDEFSAAIAGKRDLGDALERAGIDVKARFIGVIEQLQARVAVLLERAQAAGAVRDDLNSKEVFALVHGACVAAEQQGGDAATMRRMLGIVRDGFRPVHG